MSSSLPDTRPRLADLPDASGHFGQFGGRYVPETLMSALETLEAEYRAVRDDASFREELDALLRDYVVLPTPLYEARRLAEAIGTRARILLSVRDLCHTGAHKINNTLGQALLARRLGKRRVSPRPGASMCRHRHAAALLDSNAPLHGEERHAAPGLIVFPCSSWARRSCQLPAARAR